MPKIVNHEERRRTFANAAKEVIANKGIESVRLVDVARAAGATTGSLTHYFGAKDDVLDAALDMLIADWDSQLDVGRGALIDDLMRFMPLDEESERDTRVWIAYISRSFVNASVAAKMAEYWQSYHTKLSKYLHKYEGRSREEATLLANTIGAVVDGLIIRALSERGKWPASRQRAQLESALLQLVGPSALESNSVE